MAFAIRSHWRRQAGKGRCLPVQRLLRNLAAGASTRFRATATAPVEAIPATASSARTVYVRITGPTLNGLLSAYAAAVGGGQPGLRVGAEATRLGLVVAAAVSMAGAPAGDRSGPESAHLRSPRAPGRTCAILGSGLATGAPALSNSSSWVVSGMRISLLRTRAARRFRVAARLQEGRSRGSSILPWHQTAMPSHRTQRRSQCQPAPGYAHLVAAAGLLTDHLQVPAARSLPARLVPPRVPYPALHPRRCQSV